MYSSAPLFHSLNIEATFYQLVEQTGEYRPQFPTTITTSMCNWYTSQTHNPRQTHIHPIFLVWEQISKDSCTHTLQLQAFVLLVEQEKSQQLIDMCPATFICTSWSSFPNTSLTTWELTCSLFATSIQNLNTALWQESSSSLWHSINKERGIRNHYI